MRGRALRRVESVDGVSGTRTVKGSCSASVTARRLQPGGGHRHAHGAASAQRAEPRQLTLQQRCWSRGAPRGEQRPQQKLHLISVRAPRRERIDVARAAVNRRGDCVDRGDRGDCGGRNTADCETRRGMFCRVKHRNVFLPPLLSGRRAQRCGARSPTHVRAPVDRTACGARRQPCTSRRLRIDNDASEGAAGFMRDSRLAGQRDGVSNLRDGHKRESVTSRLPAQLYAVTQPAGSVALILAARERVLACPLPLPPQLLRGALAALLRHRQLGPDAHVVDPGAVRRKPHAAVKRRVQWLDARPVADEHQRLRLVLRRILAVVQVTVGCLPCDVRRPHLGRGGGAGERETKALSATQRRRLPARRESAPAQDGPGSPPGRSRRRCRAPGSRPCARGSRAG
jgi:hypothetical protein